MAIIINNKRISGITTSGDICIRDGVVTINGKVVHEDTTCNKIEITITECFSGTIESNESISVNGPINGYVTANRSVSCDNVTGHVTAKGSVSCDNVGGDVTAGGSVSADKIKGSVKAGGSVSC